MTPENNPNPLDLLPCPFCGSSDVTFGRRDHKGGPLVGKPFWQAGCLDCDAETQRFFEIDASIYEESLESLARDAWNRRAHVVVQGVAPKAPASEIRASFARGFRYGCGANVSDEMDLLRKLSDAWKKESAQPPAPVQTEATGPDMDRLIKILDTLTDCQHGDDCKAYGQEPDSDCEDKDTDIDDNPSNFLEKCNCGLKDVFEAWKIAKALCQVQPTPEAQ